MCVCVCVCAAGQRDSRSSLGRSVRPLDRTQEQCSESSPGCRDLVLGLRWTRKLQQSRQVCTAYEPAVGSALLWLPVGRDKELPVALGEVCTPLPACGEEVEEGTSRRGLGGPHRCPSEWGHGSHQVW